MKRISSLLISIQLFIPDIQAQVIHPLENNDFVKEFLVAGSYHQTGLEADDWPDLLEVELIANEASFGPESGLDAVIAGTDGGNKVDFNKILGDSAIALAYAHFKVSAPRKTETQFMVYAQDGAKMYINGKPVLTFFNAGWAGGNCTVTLPEGDNNVVIKVPNRDWGWNLAVKVLDNEKAKKYAEEERQKNDLAFVLHSNLQPLANNNLSYTFYPGIFPKLVFEEPGLVQNYLGGDFSISTRWFDRDLAEVTYPKEPGRYAYYAEVTGSNGKVLKKSATLFCAERNWMGWNERLTADLSHLPVNGISLESWTKHREAISQFAGFAVFRSIMEQKDGAILLAFMDDVNRNQSKPGSLNTPIIANGGYHAKLKQKLLGVENKYPELEPPYPDENAPPLVQLTDKRKKKYQKFYEELKQVGEEWMADEGGPFDMVIAKEGKIIFHDSFGENEYGKFTTETPSEVASITKLFTGMLFAQFVDQGIIEIDDPVGKYLPDFPTEGPNALTLRHCFTHTGGFDFFAHGLYDGVHNPWLENILIKTLEGDTIGKKHDYNGMGYDLAGKVMEIVTGKSIFRLFREYLYDPLGMNNTIHDWDLGFSVHSTAEDLAKMAQMILNKGSYDGKRFFSEATYEKLLPTDLNAYFPQIDRKWGIGMTVMDWKVTDDETGEERFLVSDGIIGHGSATASIFWVIPKQNMIITQSRRRGNRNFAPNYIKMMEVVEKHLID